MADTRRTRTVIDLRGFLPPTEFLIALLVLIGGTALLAWISQP